MRERKGRCSPKANRLSVISSAKKKISLFGISKEMQFGVCNQCELCALLPATRRGGLFGRGEKQAERAKGNKDPVEELRAQSTVSFHWLGCDGLSVAEL